MNFLIGLISLRNAVIKHTYNMKKLKSKDDVEHYKVKIVTKHNDNRLNNYQRLQLQGWRANCDIQVIIDCHSCLEYSAKYASKAERISSVAREFFTSIVCESSN